jgi:predicted DNA binding CopG/RHH family protein
MTERHHHDPYEGMSDDELEEHFAQLFENRRDRTVSVTLRMPEDLVLRTKRIAEAQQIPYQRLIKRILESAVSRLEQGGGAAGPGRAASI